MWANKQKTRYNVGDRVVSPTNGEGVITSIDKRGVLPIQVDFIDDRGVTYATERFTQDGRWSVRSKYPTLFLLKDTPPLWTINEEKNKSDTPKYSKSVYRRSTYINLFHTLIEMNHLGAIDQIFLKLIREEWDVKSDKIQEVIVLFCRANYTIKERLVYYKPFLNKAREYCEKFDIDISELLIGIV